MTDVFFVNPPSPDGLVYIRDINRSGRRSREKTIWPQISLASLAAVVKLAGFSVDLVDCIAEKMSWDKFKEVLKEKKPKYVVINAITSIISNDLYVSYLAKAQGAKSIVIGPHITSLPKETMEKYPSVDLGILGEAESTIKELIDACEAGSDLSKVKGIVFRKEGKAIVTEKRPFIENLDSLPIALHELLPIKKYRLPYIGNEYTFVLASRGCPFFCTFCRQPIMWERKVRSRSADSIFKELQYLDSIGVKNIMFHSDTFTIDRKIVIDLCKKIVDSGLKFKWCCNSRVDTIDEEMLEWMNKAGCWMVMYGIETGSDKILNNVKKGGTATVEKARLAVSWAKKHKIKVWGYFIIGLPGETKATIEETIRFSKELPLDMVNFSVGAPYPGTEFYKQTIENNWLESQEWEDFDQNYSAIVSYPELSSKEIMQGIKKAYISWFARPKGILVFLKGCSSLENIKQLFSIGLMHLKISKND